MGPDLEGDIVVAKVTAMVVLGGAAFVVTLLPVFVSKRLNAKSKPGVQKRNERADFVLSLFLSFGGGVLLCTTFLHLLPEVTENIETLQETGGIPKDFPLPLPELIMCCGFFTMYVIEEVVHKFLHSRQTKKAKGGRDSPSISSAVLVEPDLNLTETYKEILKQDMFKVAFSPPHEEDLKIVPTKTKNYGSSFRQEVNHNHNLHYDHDHQHHHHESDEHHTLVTDTPPSLRELLIVLALTVHEGFEGLAIGLEASEGAVWYLLAAVAVHKCVIAFCIGVELVSGHTSLGLSVFYAFIYSCASPFGIAIGLALTTSDDSDLTTLLSVILQGMATGTLLYVVFFEILKRDGNRKSELAEMVVVIVGFSCMAAITIIIDD